MENVETFYPLPNLNPKWFKDHAACTLRGHGVTGFEHYAATPGAKLCTDLILD